MIRLDINFIIEAYLLNAGIITNKKYAKYEPYLLIALAINALIYIGFVSHALLNTQISRDRILLACYLVGVSTYYVLQYITRINKPRLMYLINELRRNLSGETIISTSTRRIMQKKFKPILKALLTVTASIFSAPAISFFLTDKNRPNDPNFFLLMNSITFWKVNSGLGVIIKNLFHIWLTVPGTFCYLCSTVLIAYITSNLEAHIDQIQIKFQSMFQENPLHSEITSKQRDELLKNEVRSMIERLQYLYKYSKTLTGYVEWTAHTCLFWFMDGLILILHVLIHLDDFDLAVFSKNIAILGLVLLQFYICCNITESLSHLNENLLFAMYNSDWHQISPEIRKTLLTMMIHWQNPLEIRLFNMYITNMGLFGRCFRIIYSVLNVTSRVFRR
ncbi:uncharacterized protein LOC135841589 [Planococcus citri]|uniref:uncharacterized protein LOC135841589 n=1 Tax=Planococcus citri TaxID=170843 RepID=UPI0031F7C9AB